MASGSPIARSGALSSSERTSLEVVGDGNRAANRTAREASSAQATFNNLKRTTLRLLALRCRLSETFPYVCNCGLVRVFRSSVTKKSSFIMIEGEEPDHKSYLLVLE